MHQQAMVVHAIGRACDERYLVGAGLDGQRLHLLGQHHLGVHHLVGERLVHGVQQHQVAGLQRMDVVEHAQVAHARMRGEHAMRRGAAHRQARALQVADARHKDFLARAVVDGHAHVDGGDLDPAHHGVAVKDELLSVGLDLVGGELGGLARQLLVKGARLEQDALAFLGRQRVHGAGHGADLVEHARGLEPVQDPRPGHKAHANKDDDDGDEPVGPARQSLATTLGLWLRFGLRA